MGGRGAGAGGRMGGGGGVNPENILNETSLISDRESNPQLVDNVLSSLRSMANDYNQTAGELSLATLKLNKNTMGVLAFSDGENISFNQSFWDEDKLTRAYDKSIAEGYHPGRGNKSAVEVIIAHEFGHNLNQTAANKMGLSMDAAATQIVNEARRSTTSRGVVQMARKISGYATSSNAEAIAEAVADVYGNGGRAKAESKAIVNTLRKYL